MKIGNRQRATGNSKKLKFLLFVFSTILLALCAAAHAQGPKKVPRIGFLSAGDASRQSIPAEAIRLGLRNLGYVEGQNIAFEYRHAGGKRANYPMLAAELARLMVEVIVVTGGTELVRAAKRATQTIPIVMVGPGADPVEAGLVQSLARPGGNVTGITTLSGELGGKRLELLKEAVPKIVRVFVLYELAAPGGLRDVKEALPVAARALGLTLRSWDVRNADAFDGLFAALNKERPDGLYVAASPLLNANEKRIAAFTLKSRLPSISLRSEFVDAGGLMSYGADQAAIYRRVAYFVDRILKGAKPTELPVEQPTKFELVINLNTGKQIGVTIPQKVLARADRVIR
jgi:putative ABC transport system substrate-binding protein